MPILEARHDLAHPVEGDTAWSESYYFNAYDPARTPGFFTRIGVRPNEGTMDVACRCGCRAGTWPSTATSASSTRWSTRVLEVGAVRYEMLEALRSWRSPSSRRSPARPCRARTRRPTDRATWRSTSASTR